MKEKFKCEITISRAYDKRHKENSKNYGIGCCRMFFSLKGDKGAVVFQVGTGWFLPKTVTEYKSNHIDLWNDYPTQWDLGYHSYKPMGDYHKEVKDGKVVECPSQDECSFLDGNPCFYDGTALGGDPILQRLLEEGSGAVWEELEKYYKIVFNGG